MALGRPPASHSNHDRLVAPDAELLIPAHDVHHGRHILGFTGLQQPAVRSRFRASEVILLGLFLVGDFITGIGDPTERSTTRLKIPAERIDGMPSSSLPRWARSCSPILSGPVGHHSKLRRTSNTYRSVHTLASPSRG